ncbi:hypothetical protein BJ912DRAFT_1065965 [Pholiota molesta]|nr:hypothetical protein BJ912DRAFT_1065965 [Pholiota molesta]
MPLNLNLNLNLNFASNSTSRPSPTTKRMRVARRNFYTVSLIFGGSIELAPGLSICLMPRSPSHSNGMDIAAEDDDDGGSPLPHPAVLPPLDDDDSGRSRQSKSTEDRMNGQREAPARSSVYTRHGDINVTFLPLSYIRAYLAPASASPCTTVNLNVFAPSKSLRKAKATDDDIEDAAANDYDRALPLRHP